MSDSFHGVGKMIAQVRPGAFYAEHRSEIATALMRVLDSGRYILGDEVRCFEQEFAEHFGFPSAVGVANGTDAIALALRALGVGPGDGVATVSHTAVATVAAIEMTGARPILVDINADTYTMSPLSLARTIESAHRPVKAVIAVHLYGHPADMPDILAVAQKHGAVVVEDCSQAHGAMLNGKPAGSMGDIGTFSFYPTKNLGAIGDAGLVVSNNPELIRNVRMMREYGWQRRYISEVTGVNSRLDEIQAAVLRARLPFLNADNERRRSIAAAYTEGLTDTGLTLPIAGKLAYHVYHQYVVGCDERDHVQHLLKRQGICTNIHYPVPVHHQPAYASRCSIDPNGLGTTERVAAGILSLPMYPELSDLDVAAVIHALHNSIS
jgi:dTDP-4-amino-4,6-dideoxygalactose transaminase